MILTFARRGHSGSWGSGVARRRRTHTMKTWPSSSCGIGKLLCANANEGHNNNDRGEPRFALKHGPSVVNEGGNPPLLNNTSLRGGCRCPLGQGLATSQNRGEKSWMDQLLTLGRGVNDTPPRGEVLLTRGGFPPSLTTVGCLPEPIEACMLSRGPIRN